MYQLDYVPIKPANLNDYFVRYKETNYEKYFNEFLYFYEPVLNRNAQLFITKYGLDSNRIDDLKQIFSSLLWCELQSYDSDIPLLQLINIKFSRLGTNMSVPSAVMYISTIITCIRI